MERHRILLAFGIAWLSALLLSWWVYRTTTAPQKRETVQVVAALRDVPAGKRLVAADLKLVTVDRKDLPQGAFLKTTDAVDRAAAVPLAASELVLERKIAGKGGGEGLTALIEPGMRAVGVQVNEMTGVAGFTQPGTRVDVLYTRVVASGDAATTTILQNVKVLAYGRQLEAGSRTETRATTQQTVATLLVTQEQAEKLALAVQRGRIQLALRNPLDTSIQTDARLVRSSDLGIDDGVVSRLRAPGPSPTGAAARPGGMVPARGVATHPNAPGPNAPRPSAAGAKSPAPGSKAPLDKTQENGSVVIKVFRGAKVSEEVFP